MSMYQPRICQTKGCNKQSRVKGLSSDGRKFYATKCVSCHRGLRYKQKKEYGLTLQGISNAKCERCGWWEGRCDRHKIAKSIGYDLENVVILCPNCHRLETTEVIDLNAEDFMQPSLERHRQKYGDII